MENYNDFTSEQKYWFDASKHAYRVEVLMNRLVERYKFYDTKERKNYLCDLLNKKYSTYKDLTLIENRKVTPIFKRLVTSYTLSNFGNKFIPKNFNVAFGYKVF
jgi:hypothetical protein